jgi:mutator protein MutT
MKKEKQKPHIHVSAGLIKKDGKFLIARRREGGHLAGYWEFPGGKQEKGETLKACLEREISEELGLKIRAGHVLLVVEHEYETKVITLHVMEGAILSGEPAALECQEFGWVDPVDFHNYVFPPPDEEVISFLSSHESLFDQLL